MNINIRKKENEELKNNEINILVEYSTCTDIDKIIENIKNYNDHKVLVRKNNEYLQIAATMGIPAIIVYLAFIGTIVVKGIRKMSKHKIIAINKKWRI